MFRMCGLWCVDSWVCGVLPQGMRTPVNNPRDGQSIHEDTEQPDFALPPLLRLIPVNGQACHLKVPREEEFHVVADVRIWTAVGI